MLFFLYKTLSFSDSDDFSTEADEIQSYTELTNQDYRDALKYVRDLFKYFKKSPLKMSHLQEVAKEKEKPQNTALPLDVVTRWNSIIPMVKRYLELRDLIRETLTRLNETDKYSSRHDVALNELSEALEPLAEAVLVLSKSDSNLIKAEFAVRYVLEKLSANNTNLSGEFYEAVKKRYNERRIKTLVTMLIMLQTGGYPANTNDLEYCNKREVKKAAESLMSRLFGDTAEESLAEEPQSSLNSGINSAMDNYFKSCLTAPKSSLEKDLALLETTKTRSSRLDNLLKALLSLKPTSTVCEQAFSTASGLKTKYRNRMSPQKLNTLVWLKYFFKNKE